MVNPNGPQAQAALIFTASLTSQVPGWPFRQLAAIDTLGRE